jgi:BlaI family penicillinase repressor
MKRLTPKEEEIMHILWQLKKGFVRDILALLPDPKPSYNTVSTIVRILENKRFVGHLAFGNTHEYYPLIDKQSYTRYYMKSILRDYFENSYQQLVSFFAGEDDFDPAELEKLLREIRGRKKNG